MLDPVFALSPLDGRYGPKVEELRYYFSEAALMQYRLLIEVEWLIYLCNEVQLENTRELKEKEIKDLRKLYESFSKTSAHRIKTIEKTTNHDVKAIEYFIKEKMAKTSVKDVLEFVHFACTSEDINNLSYALMLKGGVEDQILTTIESLQAALEPIIKSHAAIPMMSHTHGQPASPTTFGKEIGNVLVRILRQYDQLTQQPYLGKMNGAVGNWNAHLSAYPELDWLEIGEVFVEHLGLESSRYTTQIEPHDFLAELCHNLIRLNTVLIDFDRDMWTYIGKGYIKQKVKKGEVGSSTMPHKVNPIDFENSEGNLGLANSVLSHLAMKLPVSRMQRDLTDSTVLRNLGVAIGYTLLGYQSLLKGLGKIEINKEALAQDLDNHWEVLAEPLQTVMRRYGIPNPYEKLKELTRGKGLTKAGYTKFVKSLKLPEKEKKRLAKLTPATYIGLAKELAEDLI